MVNKRAESRKKGVLYVAIAVLLAILALLVLKVVSVLDEFRGKVEVVAETDDYAYRKDGSPEYLINGEWYVRNDDIENFLLIGIDKYESAVKKQNGYRNTQQADALFLLSIDHEKKTYNILHINRDTMANIRALAVNGQPYSQFEGQLAIAHTYGSGKNDSCENTVWSVSDYLYGLKIDHYVSFTMDSVAVVNDSVGGVSIEVLDDMTSENEALEKGKTVLLKGDLALSYVRARGGLADSSNLARMSRQRQYITALLEQTKKTVETDESAAMQIFFNISEYLISDCQSDELLSMAEVVSDYTFEGINTIKGEAKKGERFMEFRADEDALKMQIRDLYYKKK